MGQIEGSLSCWLPSSLGARFPAPHHYTFPALPWIYHLMEHMPAIGGDTGCNNSYINLMFASHEILLDGNLYPKLLSTIVSGVRELQMGEGGFIGSGGK